MIRAGVSPDNVSARVASIDEELTKMAADGPTDTELAESRQYLIGSMPRNLETNLGIANYLQTIEFFNLGLDYDLRVPDLLRAVTSGRRARVGEADARRRARGGRRGWSIRSTARMRIRRCAPSSSTSTSRSSIRARRFRPRAMSGSARRHGIRIDASRFDAAVEAASSILDDEQDHVYSRGHLRPLRARVIEAMGGTGQRLDVCAREIYDEWAVCQHFFLYDDVAAGAARARGSRLRPRD